MAPFKDLERLAGFGMPGNVLIKYDFFQLCFISFLTFKSEKFTLPKINFTHWRNDE